MHESIRVTKLDRNTDIATADNLVSEFLESKCWVALDSECGVDGDKKEKRAAVEMAYVRPWNTQGQGV
jgi:hypothetical protein